MIVNNKSRYFKNVGYDGDKYFSIYNNNFLYYVGKYVNGGENGIYVYNDPIQVLGGYYSYSDAYILELVPMGEIIHQYDNQFILMDNVKVINSWTRREFEIML